MIPIEQNKQREELTDIYKSVGVLSVEFFHHLISQVEGIGIVERVDLESTLFYNCHHHVFAVRMGEGWCKLGEEIPKSLDHDTVRFLRKKGFEMVGEPQDRDVVSYRKKWPHPYYGKNYFANHWGIFENGMVTSKFGRGHIYQHPLMAVPRSFGDKIAFFRKNTYSKKPYTFQEKVKNIIQSSQSRYSAQQE